MDATWQLVLAVGLGLNAVLGFAYRVYRLAKGGPLADVYGQALLGLILGVLAVLVAVDVGWARWPALAYAVVFGLVVMPIWVLAVLIPLRPRLVDYLFTATYWCGLAVIGLAAVLA